MVNNKIQIIVVIIIIILAGFGFYYYEMEFTKAPLEAFCGKMNNSELIEYKDQWCSSSGSDFLVKCSDGKIYGVDTIRHCVKWDTWGDCIKQGKTKFKLSHLTYPRC